MRSTLKKKHGRGQGLTPDSEERGEGARRGAISRYRATDRGAPASRAVLFLDEIVSMTDRSVLRAPSCSGRGTAVSAGTIRAGL